jgi:hypothetical protein
MKLSELVTHTSIWTVLSRTIVESHSRYLREAGLITSGPRGLVAADMTVEDKITLFVAVLGCGTARTCAKDVPRLLALKSTKTDFPGHGKISFLERPNLKSALIALFDDIQSDRIEAWVQQTQRGYEKVLSKQNLSAELIVKFEVDGDRVKISLSASAQVDVGLEKQASWQALYEQEFGAIRAAEKGGFSRRIHEISLERLKGWGACLNQ